MWSALTGWSGSKGKDAAQSTSHGPASANGAPQPGRFEVHLLELLDMPRAYKSATARRPKNYVVVALINGKEVGRSNEIHGVQGYTGTQAEDYETVDCRGETLNLKHSNHLFVLRVEYSDGIVIGQCHIHRSDDRSQQEHPYELTYPEGGQRANCGLRCYVKELDGPPRPPPGPPQTVFSDGPTHFPQAQQFGPSHPAMQQLDLQNGFAPQQFGPPHSGMQHFHADSPNGFAQAQQFGPPHPAMQQFAADPSVGFAHAQQFGPPHPGPPQGRKPVPPLFGPVPDLLEMALPGRVAKPRIPPEMVAAHAPAPPVHGAPHPMNNAAAAPAPPMQPAVTSVTYSLPPGQQDVRSPMIEQGHATTQTNVYSYTLPPVGPQPLAIENGQASLPPVGRQPLAIADGQVDDFNHPGSYLIGQDHGSANDGMTEAWCAPPPASWQDNLFGSDQDLEVKAMYSEPWDRPLDAFDRPLFVEEDKFEDMDRTVIGRETSLRRRLTHIDQNHVKDRKKDGLPEFSSDKWVPSPPKKATPKALPAPTAIPPPDPAAPPPKMVQNVRRAKGKVNAELFLIGNAEKHIEEQLNDRRLSHLDESLFSRHFETQAIGCLERDHHGKEKRVWLRTQRSCKPQSVDEDLLRRFCTPELQISVACRAGDRGKHSKVPNQDNFSITQTHLGMALYVVCDGHGPLGHIAAFRVAQSLPKFTFDLLASPDRPHPTERLLLVSFAEANTDLQHFARDHKLDMQCSGATCSAVLRIDANVVISWVGDCGACLATMTEQIQTVDMMTEPHTTDNPKELHRVAAASAKLRPVMGHNAKRIFRPGIEGPGTYATRSFGDFAVFEEYGVTVAPDFKNSSFAQVPGLLLLGSGGLWEVLPNPQSSLALLEKFDLHRHSGRHREGVSKLCDLAQTIWRKESKGDSEVFTDDVTCMMLHWERPVTSGPPPPPPPPQARTGHGDNIEDTLMKDAKVGGLFDPPHVTTELRSKPTIAAWLDDLHEVERYAKMQAVSTPDPMLSQRDILTQVVSCIDSGEAFGAEKTVWFSEKGEPRAVRIHNSRKKDWLSKFKVGNIEVVPISRRGQRHAQSRCPNQDNYSITAASNNKAVYVLCDGHGTLGHLVSFRVTQTLPVFVLEGLAASSSANLQKVFVEAFQKAKLDLEDFAKKHQLDFSESGTSCSAVLRQGDEVFVSWLGDCRVLCASVESRDNRRVDFMSTPHLASSATEYRRLCKAGLPVKVASGEPARIYTGTTDGPGLTTSRALGDFSLRQGVAPEPDVKKTSFESVPGLIFLASGGLCEHFGQSPGEAMLRSLVVEGALLDRGLDHALQSICSHAQQQWQNLRNTYCEDISGILIHWSGAGRIVANSTAVTHSSEHAHSSPNQQQGIHIIQGSVQKVAPAGHANPSLAAHMRSAPLVHSALDSRATPVPVSTPIDGRDLPADRIKQAPAGSSPTRILPSSSLLSAPSVPTSNAEPHRNFLQARPQNSTPSWQTTSQARTSVAQEHHSLDSHATFLQAAPGRLTTVLE